MFYRLSAKGTLTCNQFNDTCVIDYVFYGSYIYFRIQDSYMPQVYLNMH